MEADDVFKNKYEVTFDLLHDIAFKGCGLGQTILGPKENIMKQEEMDGWMDGWIGR